MLLLGKARRSPRSKARASLLPPHAPVACPAGVVASMACSGTATNRGGGARLGFSLQEAPVFAQLLEMPLRGAATVVFVHIEVCRTTAVLLPRLQKRRVLRNFTRHRVPVQADLWLTLLATHGETQEARLSQESQRFVPFVADLLRVEVGLD